MSDYSITDRLPHICPNCGCGMMRPGELERQLGRAIEAANWIRSALPDKALQYLRDEALVRYPDVFLREDE